jgi:predicted nucleic acid-binding protein
VSRDAHHRDAARAAARLRDERQELWTLDSVLTELWLLLRRDLGHVLCDRAIQGLLDAGLRREPLLPEDYHRAWELGLAWPDQDFSLTDRQAFSAIERVGRLRAWAYDHHFAVVRLGPARDRAMEMVR